MELPPVDPSTLDKARQDIRELGPVLKVYGPLILQYALRRRLSPEQAEDVSQGILLKIGTAKGLKSFDTFNQSRGARRSRKYKYHEWSAGITVLDIRAARRPRMDDKATHDPSGLILSMIGSETDDPSRPMIVREMLDLAKAAFESMRTENQTLCSKKYENIYAHTTRGRIADDSMAELSRKVSLPEAEVRSYFDTEEDVEPFLQPNGSQPQVKLFKILRMKVGPLYYAVLTKQWESKTYATIAKELKAYVTDVTNWRHAGAERLKDILRCKGYTHVGSRTMEVFDKLYGADFAGG